MDATAFRLSKSTVTRGLTCRKSLYLHIHNPELRDEVSGSQLARMETGTDVGILARQLFPGGVEIPYDGLSYDDQLRMTRSEIEKGTEILYEAAFRHDGVFVKTDILRKGDTGWELYEVKSSNGLKDYHTDDVAVQYHVLQGAGLPIARVYLVHLNGQYVRRGEIEVGKLFVAEDLTDTVTQRQDFIRSVIPDLRIMLAGAMPDTPIGTYCDKPFTCDFHDHCWQHVPELSVFSLGGSTAIQFGLYRDGIVSLADVPAERLENRQKLVLEAFLEKGQYVNKEGIREFLRSLWYPLYFLDFETFMVAIPPFDGLKPYQQVPYQYSLHWLADENAELEHDEFLALPNADPRRELTERLVNRIPENACVLAYHSSFEKERLAELAEAAPEYGSKIATIIGHTVDLKIPFKRRDLYHWEMFGSASQKYVLPALVPELSYKEMEIGSGGMAMDAYFSMCASDDPAAVEKIRRDLLDYCNLDTLGMVRLWEKLREVSR